MPSNIQFIITTGEASVDKKRALRKLVRSHAAAQHYREKRKTDVKNYELEMGNTATNSQACRDDTDSLWDSTLQLEMTSPFAYLGQGISDPFIKVPIAHSPRMQKHLFYC